MHLVFDAFSEADGRAGLTPVRIIGVGSPFGADRVGWDVADALARDPWFGSQPPKQVRVSRADRPGVRLLEWLAAPGLVILIDAMRGGAKPGTVNCFDGRALPADAGFATTHDFGIKAALELAGALGEIVPAVRVFGIEIGESSGPLPAGPHAAPYDKNIINEIKSLVDNFHKHKELTHARYP